MKQKFYKHIENYRIHWDAKYGNVQQKSLRSYFEGVEAS